MTPSSGRSSDESFSRLSEQRFSQSLERGLEVLECFTPKQPVRGVNEIAEQLGMSRPTTHRYMSTLLELGYLEQEKNRKYRLTLAVTNLGMSAMNSMSLPEHAARHMRELREESRLTVALAVLNGERGLCVERLAGSRPGQRTIDQHLQVGCELALHCTALGKVLLAHLPSEQQKDVLGRLELTKAGPNTITGKRTLAAELASVREEGLACDDEESAAGMQALAAPVLDEYGDVVAAIGLHGHLQAISLQALRVSLSPHLLTAAARVSARLGYRRPDERNG
jgi:IclR family transcriptional regulator, pca regulon regulatory protein